MRPKKIGRKFFSRNLDILVIINSIFLATAHREYLLHIDELVVIGGIIVGKGIIHEGRRIIKPNYFILYSNIIK